MFTFIESTAFARICPVYLDDDEYSELQQFMMQILKRLAEEFQDE